MRDFAKLAEIAFSLHKHGHLPHDELVHVLQQCINGAALENGYADKYGLPFPKHAEARSNAHRSTIKEP